MIRRGPDGKLRAVAYSDVYKKDLAALRAGSSQCGEVDGQCDAEAIPRNTRGGVPFERLLCERRGVGWILMPPSTSPSGLMKLTTTRLSGYKAAFEAYINIRDDTETAKLKFFGDHMQEVENNLPIEAKYRNPKIGALSPIRVVNEVFAAGDGDHGVQTAAYNLPNDERVVHEKGSKRVMLKNVQEAKFKSTLEPISKIVLAPAAY